MNLITIVLIIPTAILVLSFVMLEDREIEEGIFQAYFVWMFFVAFLYGVTRITRRRERKRIQLGSKYKLSPKEEKTKNIVERLIAGGEVRLKEPELEEAVYLFENFIRAVLNKPADEVRSYFASWHLREETIEKILREFKQRYQDRIDRDPEEIFDFNDDIVKLKTP